MLSLVNRGECFGTVCGAVVGPNTSYVLPPRCRGQDSDEAGSLHGAELPKYLSLGVAGVDAAQAESWSVALYVFSQAESTENRRP